MTVIINGTNGIVGVSGSAASPAITVDADTNTGIFFPEADKIGIVTGGTERMRINNDGIALNGSTSGSVTFTVPAVAGDNILTFPAATDTVATLAATQTLTNKTIQGGAITSDTAQLSTSGTSIDFTNIPSWVKRITVMFRGVSTSTTTTISNLLIQLGTSSGVTITGYATYGLRTGATTVAGGVNSTVGFPVVNNQAASMYSGSVIFSALGGNIWTGFGIIGDSVGGNSNIITGGISLAETLDRVRITTANGTDTFDAGSINIMYE